MIFYWNSKLLKCTVDYSSPIMLLKYRQRFLDRQRERERQTERQRKRDIETERRNHF